ncbi:PREDICTED: uncharacterized protein LOC104713353 isoform X1 [Camelina sativa]|uniref:Uncharacterized protein LOC104713353 isoform X1 n=1 Tax=Camelina sativa TaxID=90675 RepID=A0ABM1R2M4_CAMSA|nr:PREDICTED: uncharacterized protein LOC104713353 isoform X1 [Camelina sativa]
MAESKTKLEEIRKWVSDHKLRTVGCLWLSGITGSIAYNWSQPAMKTSVKIIHARKASKFMCVCVGFLFFVSSFCSPGKHIVCSIYNFLHYVLPLSSLSCSHNKFTLLFHSSPGTLMLIITLCSMCVFAMNI